MIYVLSRSSDLFRAPKNLISIYLLPVVVVSILCFSYFGFINALIFFIVALIFQHFCVRLGDLMKSAYILTSLKIKFDSKIIKFSNFCDFEDFFGKGIGSSLSNMSSDFLRPRHNQVFLFAVETKQTSQVFGTFSVNLSPGVTAIFHPYKPGDLNATRTLVLFHEIGHASSKSWYRTREYIIRAFSTIIIMLIILGNSQMLAQIPIFISLIVSQLMLKYIFRFQEEIEADKISVEIFEGIYMETNENRYSESRLLILDYFLTLLERNMIRLPADRWMFNFHNVYRNKLFPYILNGNSPSEDEQKEMMRPIKRFHVYIQLVIIGFIVPFLFLLTKSSRELELTSPLYLLSIITVFSGLLIFPTFWLLAQRVKQFSTQFSAGSSYNRNNVNTMLYLQLVHNIKEFGHGINKLQREIDLMKNFLKEMGPDKASEFVTNFDKKIEESVFEQTGQERPSIDEIRNWGLGRDDQNEKNDK
jgi:hypothetical protein